MDQKVNDLCVVCGKGNYIETHSPIEYRPLNKNVYIKINIPHLLCPYCGEAFLYKEDFNKVEKLLVATRPFIF